jgi:murein DD-endopeptidase MepM/ murein hydrolase activator NlpD
VFEKLHGWQNILRAALIFCIFYYFPPSAVNLIKTIENRLAAVPDGGRGGMDYSEKEIARIVSPNIALNDDAADAAAAADAADAASTADKPEEFSIPQMLVYSSYTVQSGDMIGLIASVFGLKQDTLISVNDISNTRSIQVGRKLLIPNQDGIMHKVLQNETMDDIAKKYEISAASITTVNELFSENAKSGSNIFIPNARMDSTKLQEINGDLFIWPVRGRITSIYGYRRSPITGLRSFHSGLDISANIGVPIKAAMSGRVISTGYNDIFGYFVVISHHSNYRTLYAHMSRIRTESGAYVRTNQIIGDVGNTGQSTGAHLHFQVYKGGLTVNPMPLMN